MLSGRCRRGGELTSSSFVGKKQRGGETGVVGMGVSSRAVARRGRAMEVEDRTARRGRVMERWNGRERERKEEKVPPFARGEALVGCLTHECWPLATTLHMCQERETDNLAHTLGR